MSATATGQSARGARLDCDSPERWRLSGDLDFDTVPALLTQIEQQLPRAGALLEVELGEVAHSDSAGMALLMEWTRRARTRRTEVHFLHPPEQLLNLARLTGLAGLLGMDD